MKNIKIICVGQGSKNIFCELEKKENIFVGYLARKYDNKGNIPKNSVIIKERFYNNPEIVQYKMEKYESEIKKTFLDGAKVLIVVSPLGGTIGSNFAPYIIELAKNEGILTLPFLVLPFGFEGSTRCNKAIQAVKKIKKINDNSVIFDKEKFQKGLEERTACKDAFLMVNKIVAGIVELLTEELEKPKAEQNLKSKIDEIRHQEYMADFDCEKTVTLFEMKKDLDNIKRIILPDIDNYISELNEITEKLKKRNKCSHRLPLLLAYLIRQKEIIDKWGMNF